MKRKILRIVSGIFGGIAGILVADWTAYNPITNEYQVWQYPILIFGGVFAFLAIEEAVSRWRQYRRQVKQSDENWQKYRDSLKK